MSPCFHHFLLFSCKKKWDCTAGDFYSFSCSVVHDGALLGFSRACRKHHGCCGGLGKASRNLPICRRVHRQLCLGTAELCYYRGYPATTELREVCRSFVCKPREALHALDKHLLLLLEGYKVWWVKRDTTSILQNLRVWFFSFPLSLKFTVHTIWHEVLLIFIFLQNYDVLCSWLCHCECILHPCVFTCLNVPWRSIYMWVSLDPWGEDVCVRVCVYVETAVCSAFFLTYWLL